MKKVLKKILKFFTIFLVVLIALLIAIPIIFKDEILEKVKEEANNNLNAKLEFSDFELSIFRSFPDLSVELKDLKLIGIKEFKKDTLVSFKSFYAGLDVMSVVSGDVIAVKAIILDEPNISAKVLKDGKANWDIAKASEEVAQEDTTTSEPTQFKIKLNKFAINKANISYDDKSMNVLAKIKNFNFNLKGDFTQDFTSLDIKTDIETLDLTFEGIKYMNKAAFEFISLLDADLKNMKFTFNENIFRLNKLELGFSGFVEMPTDDIKMDIKFATKKTDFKTLLSLVPAIYLKDFAGLKTAGKLALSGYAKGTQNDKNIPSFGAELIVENAMFAYPDLPKSIDNINIDIKVKNPGGSGDNTTVDINKFHVEMAKNPIDITMNVQTSATDVELKGDFNAKIELDNLKDALPLEGMSLKGLFDLGLKFGGKLSDIEKERYHRFKADGMLAINNFEFTSKDFPAGAKITDSKLMFSPKKVELESFNMLLGKSDISMKGKITNILTYLFKDGTIKGELAVNSKMMNINELMPPETAPQQEPQTVEDTTALEAFEIPANIDFRLNSNMKEIIYDNIEIKNLVGIITLKDSKAALDRLSMNILDGSLVMNGSYDAKNIEKPKADFGLDIRNFDIKKTATTFNTVGKLAPIAKKCDGKISGQIKLRTVLDNHLSPILNTVDANGGLTSRNIAIKNATVFNKFSDITKMDKYRNPTLRNVNVKFRIEDGVMTIDPVTQRIGNSKAVFSGSQNLDQTINYRMDLTVPRSEFGSGANSFVNGLLSKAKLKMGNTVDLAVLFKGTIADPKVSVDLKGAAASVVNQISDELKKQVDKILAEADAKAKKLLAEAQKQGDKIKKEAKIAATKIRQASKPVAKKIRDEGKVAAKKVRDEAKKAGDKLIKKAGSNPFTKKAAEASAKKLIKEADKKANKLEQEADKKARKLESEANSKAGKLESEAAKKSHKLIDTARISGNKLKSEAKKKTDKMIEDGKNKAS